MGILSWGEKKKDLYVIRYGAYGDMIYMSGILNHMFNLYGKITLETGIKGYELFKDDTRLSKVVLWEPGKIPIAMRGVAIQARLEKIKKSFKGEVISFQGAMEHSSIVHELHPDMDLPIEERAAKYGKSFYDQHFEKAGLEVPKNFNPADGIMFTSEERDIITRWSFSHAKFFKLAVVISGSTMQKVFPAWLKPFCCSLIDEMPKLKIFLFGDEEAMGEDWTYDRTISYVRMPSNTMPFKQALGMMNHMEFVLGPETGLLVGAGMYGIPKICLCTSANKLQFAKYTLNDFSIQSSAPCSPCYGTCYCGDRCEKEWDYNKFPICTVSWDYKAIKNTIRKAYERNF